MKTRATKMSIKGRSRKQFQNPTEINTVLRNVFRYLNVDELKTCRLVCKIWNFEAEPLLRKNAKIVFGCRKGPVTTGIQNTTNFLKAFRHFSMSTTNIQFSAFSFLDCLLWRASDFKMIIDLQEKIEQLEFSGVMILNDNGVRETEYNISDWFTDLCVSKLTIKCGGRRYSTATVLKLSLNVLTFTKDINLYECSIEISNDTFIVPNTINLVSVIFWKNGYILPVYRLDNSIDFRKAKDISIIYGDLEGYTTTILDLAKLPLHVTYMKLQNVILENWNNAESTIQTLVLEDIPVLEKTQLRIRELHFAGASINLHALPRSIENLHFPRSFNRTDISSSHPLALPNLKLLRVENYKEFPKLSLFANCSNLRDIEISEVIKDNVLLKLNWIPKSVTRMSLEGITNIINGDSAELKLEKLTLINYSLASAAKVVRKIIPNILVVQWKLWGGSETSESVYSFLQRFEHLLLFMGPFHWDNSINRFETSALATHVDQKSEYYVFENKQGRAIPHLEN